MTPDQITPEQALASAYLDGDVTADERARVEATPELLALVASVRHVATAIAAVPTPPDAGREAGISAALAQFDALGTGSNVVSLAGRRRLSNAVLSAAAAVVLLGVVGITVLQSGGNSDKSETASLQTDTKMAEPAVAEDAIGAGDNSSGGEVLIALEAPIEIENLEQLAALTVPTPPAADTSPVADTTAAVTESDSQRLESLNTDALECMSDTQQFLADIYYKGVLAIAVRDTVTDVTEAIDSTCTVLARVGP